MIGWLTAIAMPPWARTLLVWAAVAGMVALYMIGFRKRAEKVGALKEKLEQAYGLDKLQRTTQERVDAVPRPDRARVSDRMRDNSF